MSYLATAQDLIHHDYYRVDYWHAFERYRYRSPSSFANIFDAPVTAINSIFSAAHKHALLTPSLETLSENRAAHSISTLLLGNILGNGLLGNTNIHSDPSFLNFGWESYSLSYVWSLTCLYHDFGYFVEQRTDLCQDLAANAFLHDNLAASSTFLLSEIKEILKINLSLIHDKRYLKLKPCPPEPSSQDDDFIWYLLQLLNAYDHIDTPLFFKDKAIKFPHYSKTTIRNYLAYRAFGSTEHACIDHGIIGGLLFFDSIIKSYAKAYSEEKEHHQNISMEYFTTHSLTFSFNQLPVFAYISDCISSHNIWTVPYSNRQFEKYSNLYNTYELNHLVGNKIKKINFHQNPLLFLLAITDSLEPYKIFNRDHIGSFDNAPYSEDDVIHAFSNFDIVATPEKITVSVKDIYTDHLADTIQGLCEWIDVSCDIFAPTKLKNGWSQFEIYINPISAPFPFHARKHLASYHQS